MTYRSGPGVNQVDTTEGCSLQEAVSRGCFIDTSFLRDVYEDDITGDIWADLWGYSPDTEMMVMAVYE